MELQQRYKQVRFYTCTKTGVDFPLHDIEKKEDKDEEEEEKEEKEKEVKEKDEQEKEEQEEEKEEEEKAINCQKLHGYQETSLIRIKSTLVSCSLFLNNKILFFTDTHSPCKMKTWIENYRRSQFH